MVGMVGLLAAQGVNKSNQSKMPLDLVSSMLDNSLFSDIKIKGSDGKEFHAHRVYLARSEVFERLLSNGMKESTQDVIEFPEFSSNALRVITGYIYTGGIIEENLTIEIVAEAFYCADFFLLEQLKLQLIEFLTNYLKNDTEGTINISARILSQLLECMKSTDNELADLLYNSINPASLKSIEYCNLNAEALEYILSKIIKEETNVFSTLEYDIFHYIVLWAADEISEEALSFYNSCLPSSEFVKNLNATHLQEWNFKVPFNFQESHAKYRSSMIINIEKVSYIFNYSLERIHPFIISNIIEPLDGLISPKTLMDIYRKQALTAGNFVRLDDDVSFQWDVQGNDSTPFFVTSKSISREWIRTKIPISGQSLVEWDIVVEKLCKHFYIGICAENGRRWAFGWRGIIHQNVRKNTDVNTKEYGKNFNEKDTITVHLDMEKRTCSFSVNGKRYPVAFRGLPSKIYPTVSLCAPGKARIKPHVSSKMLYCKR